MNLSIFMVYLKRKKKGFHSRVLISPSLAKYQRWKLVSPKISSKPMEGAPDCFLLQLTMIRFSNISILVSFLGSH
ncbi:hypothetical protein L1987_36432 [Smallanthus sonchifolius]|uniref:Uncharacterized protein n=1 Tax=Smallanthus sonchifolius TaxID=185202 RepID=A0ACB9HEX3_9ASTR|nr:hypothetical protein L1987_36432 [Smallanthus sonchifolius]